MLDLLLSTSTGIVLQTIGENKTVQRVASNVER